jgi:hypothetical protein
MNFNFIDKIPIYSTPIVDYDEEINKLKKIVTDQSDKINELITIVNVLKTSTQSIVYDFLNHMIEYHCPVIQSNQNSSDSTESESEKYDYGELDSEIESDTDTEEYKQLVEETYDKIFNESEVGKKRSRGRPPNKERLVKKSNVEVDKDDILFKVKCPNSKISKSYVVSNYKLEKQYFSSNKKHTILELSNKKKYCFGKDFAFNFYNNSVCLTNIIRRTLTHLEDYMYVRVSTGIYQNRTRIVLTRSGLLKAINYIKNNKISKSEEQLRLIEEYLEFANELD